MSSSSIVCEPNSGNTSGCPLIQRQPPRARSAPTRRTLRASCGNRDFNDRDALGVSASNPANRVIRCSRPKSQGGLILSWGQDRCVEYRSMTASIDVLHVKETYLQKSEKW